MLLKTCLMVVVASVCLGNTSCEKDDYPHTTPKLVSWKRQAFLPHALIDAKQIVFEADRTSSGAPAWNYNMKDLDGHYCISAKQMGDALDWGRRRPKFSSAETLMEHGFSVE